MYIIYEHTSGIFQVGFLTQYELNITRGILNQNLEKKHFNNDNLFFISFAQTESPAWQGGDIFSDFRVTIHNIFLKNITYYIFKIFFLIKKIISVIPRLDRGIHPLLKSIAIWLLIIISLFYFVTAGFHTSKKEIPLYPSLNQKSIEDVTYFKNFFKETKLATKIAEKNNFYTTAEIPKIKGISAFQVLPLTDYKTESSANKNSSEYSASIAVPFKKIIKITADNAIEQVEPFLICDQNNSEKFYLFRLKTEDEVLIFKRADIAENIDYPHFVFFKSEEKYQICPSIL